jgi:hypothetical protein
MNDDAERLFEMIKSRKQTMFTCLEQLVFRFKFFICCCKMRHKFIKNKQKIFKECLSKLD